MEKEKRKELKRLLFQEEKRRSDFKTLKRQVTKFVEESNAHDKDWQTFWTENLKVEKPYRFIKDDKIIVFKEPKNLYHEPIYVEGIFYNEEFSLLEYDEEAKPIILDQAGDE